MAVKIAVYGQADLKQIDNARKKLDALERDAKKNAGGFTGAMAKMSGGARSLSTHINSVALVYAAAGIAIGKFASDSVNAYKDARTAELQMQNTIDNMPMLAGESARSFKDLAGEIQDLTAVEDDAALAAQAMLGTFHMTGDEIRDITPLVADYARKFKVDMVDASKQVGKAVAGQITALKRNGITIDENLYKTDRFAAVQKALREQVGGFAQQEAQSGIVAAEQLANAFNDLQETIGEELAPQMIHMTDDARELITAYGELDDATGNVTVRSGELAIGGALVGRMFGGMGAILGTVWGATTALAGSGFGALLKKMEEVLTDGYDVRTMAYLAANGVGSFGEKAGGAAAPIGAMADATGAATDAAGEATAATDEYTRALDGQKVAMDSIEGKQRTLAELRLDASDAAISARDAEDRYTDAVKEHGKKSDEAKKAHNDLERAKMRSADASAILSEKEVELGDTEKELAKEQAYYKHLERMRRKAMEFATALGTVQRRQAAIENRGTNSGGPKEFAAGGVVSSPTYALIGEAGPEVVIPLSRRAGSYELLEYAMNRLGATTQPAPSGSRNIIDLRGAHFGAGLTRAQVQGWIGEVLDSKVRNADMLGGFHNA